MGKKSVEWEWKPYTEKKKYTSFPVWYMTEINKPRFYISIVIKDNVIKKYDQLITNI